MNKKDFKDTRKHGNYSSLPLLLGEGGVFTLGGLILPYLELLFYIKPNFCDDALYIFLLF